jgi:hypothetical protein
LKVCVKHFISAILRKKRRYVTRKKDVDDFIKFNIRQVTNRKYSIGKIQISWMAAVQFPAEAGLFSSPLCPDQLWGSSSLLSSGYSALSLGVR